MQENNQETVQELDKWQLALEDVLQKLNKCQEEKQNSCFACDKTFECNLRKEYVNAVFASMSKGSSGGFEF